VSLAIFKQAEGSDVAVVRGIATGRASVAPLVRRDDMKASGGEREHHLSPTGRSA
jgi:hypothetical protein